MKDVNDFDVRQFAPESSAIVTTAAGVGTRQSKQSVLTVTSERSGLTEHNEATGQPAPTPLSEHVEEIVPTQTNGQTKKPRQIASTSATVQSAQGRQTVLAQSPEPIQPIESPQPTQSTPIPPSRTSYRQHRASLDEYREVFLNVPKITDRQPVFVSRDVRDKIDGMVRRLGERKMGVSGFLENLARHHINLYSDDLEQWKRL